MFFHKKETPNLNTIFFKKNASKIKKIPKTLIISGGSRNGNHLIWSLLDGNKGLPILPGEDKFLSQVFWRNLVSPNKFLHELKTKKSSFLRKLSGLRSDKWIRVYKGKTNKKVWAGKHGPKVMPLIEFPTISNPAKGSKINYPKYKDYLHKNFKKDLNFYNIWSLYLDAFQCLTKNFKKRLLYKYIHAESGLRRELLFLAQNDFNFICLVPVRKFETFYFSKVKGVFNSTEIKDLFIKEAWEQWYHKTSDYLYLKRKFPKKIILLPFEDFANISKRKKSVKKLLKLLNLKFYKINLIPTHYKKKVLPNSSFKEKVDSYRKKNLKKEFVLSFPEEKLPVEYKKFYKKIRKKFY